MCASTFHIIAGRSCFCGSGCRGRRAGSEAASREQIHRPEQEACAGEAAQAVTAASRGFFVGHGKGRDLQGTRAGPAKSVGTRTARRMPVLHSYSNPWLSFLSRLSLLGSALL